MLVIEYHILDKQFLNCSQINVVDVVSKVQVFNSLMACGMKLSLSLVVLVIVN